MIFLKRLAILFYVSLLLFFSCGIVLFSAHLLKPPFVLEIFRAIYFDDTLRIAFGVFGAILLVLNFVFYQFFSVNVHREKIIAFDNPTGRVTVSLIAMEDLVKRIVLKLSEVKDVRSVIKATKRGLDIKVRLTLYADCHIPDVTARIQQLVLKKVQEAIGLTEPMNIEIYVGKIIAEPIKGKKSDASDDNPRLNIPFQGYRA